MCLDGSTPPPPFFPFLGNRVVVVGPTLLRDELSAFSPANSFFRFENMSNSAAQSTPAPAPIPAAANVTAAAPFKAPPAPIGLTAAGTPVYASLQPTVASLAVTLTPALSDGSVDLGSVLPLPTGLELIRSPEGHQLQLLASPFFASKLRRIFGYVAEIRCTDGAGTETPAQLQLVTRIPFRYGRTTAEKDFSWVLVRLQAFVSKALFAQPARVIKLGSVVAGFAEPSSGTAHSCQIVGWDVCSLDEWRQASPASVPANFDLAVNRAGFYFRRALFPHFKHGQCFRPAPAECHQLFLHEAPPCFAWRLLCRPNWRHICGAAEPVGPADCPLTWTTPGSVDAVWQCAFSCCTHPSSPGACPLPSACCFSCSRCTC